MNNNTEKKSKGVFFNPIPFSVAFFCRNVYSLNHSSENGRFGRSPKPSIAKSRRFLRLLRDLRFVTKFDVTLAKPTMCSSNSNVAADFVCRFRPIKQALFQGSRIFRIHILLNSETLFLEGCRF